MAYTLDIALALGSSKAGIADLRAQLVDSAGDDVGSAVSTGFTEVGAGNYLWHYTAFPDAHRGGVVFYSNAAPSTVLALAAINPEEAERIDTNINSRSTLTAPQVWGYAERTLTSFGSLVSSIANAVWTYASRSLTATAVQTAAAMTGQTFDILVTCTYDITLTGLSFSADDEHILTIKRNKNDADSAAVIQVSSANGLSRLAGATYGTSADGSLDLTSTTAHFVLTDTATALLSSLAGTRNIVYDIKNIVTGAQVTTGAANIDWSITRAMS